MQKEDKKNIIKKFQTNAKDTGSPQVQIAILTQSILDLTDHLKTHTKDNHSRRGLIGKVGKRRKLLHYLHMTDPASYTEVTQTLGLRK